MSAVLSDGPTVASLPLQRLQPSATNPRRRFDQAALDELTASVREHGVFQPILVRPIIGTDDYEIVAGERRYRAATAAGLERMPAIVRALQDAEALELQVLENLQRQDLHPLEEADGYMALFKRGIHTIDSLAVRVGKSRSYVYQRSTLARLCEAGRKAMYDGRMSASVGLLVARMPETDLQDRAVKALIEGARFRSDSTISLAEAQRIIHSNFMLQLAKAPFDTKDAGLQPAAGACTDCPKRAGAAPELFQDIERADTCSDPDCFQEKIRLHSDRLADKARANGQEVISGDEATKLKPNSWSPVKGHVKLSDEAMEVGYKKTYRQLLGRDFKATVLVDPATGEATEVAPSKAVDAALERAGIKIRKPGRSEHDIKNERKQKRETAFRHALMAEIRAPREHDAADALFVAIAMVERLDSDSRKRLFKLRNWVGQDDKGLTELITGECPPAAIPQLMIDAALIGEMYVPSYGADGKPERMLTIAERLGIDVAAVRRESLRRIAEEEKAKATKPAARRGKQKTQDGAAGPALVRYRDADGNTWSGRGKRPNWFRAALDAGRTVEDLLVGDASPATVGAEAVPDAPAAAEAPLPSIAGAVPAELVIGEQYQVRDDARGPTGILRKCAGRVGRLEELVGTDMAVLRWGVRPHQTTLLTREDLVFPTEASHG